jgi:hypothetical protein
MKIPKSQNLQNRRIVVLSKKTMIREGGVSKKEKEDMSSGREKVIEKDV